MRIHTECEFVVTQRGKWVTHLKQTVLTPSAGRWRFVEGVEGIRGAGCGLACSTQSRHLLSRTSQPTAHGCWRMLRNARCKVQCQTAPGHMVEPRRRPPTTACQQTVWHQVVREYTMLMAWLARCAAPCSGCHSVHSHIYMFMQDGYVIDQAI